MILLWSHTHNNNKKGGGEPLPASQQDTFMFFALTGSTDISSSILLSFSHTILFMEQVLIFAVYPYVFIVGLGFHSLI